MQSTASNKRWISDPHDFAGFIVNKRFEEDTRYPSISLISRYARYEDIAVAFDWTLSCDLQVDNR